VCGRGELGQGIMSACVRDIGTDDALFRAGQFNVSLGNDRARRIRHRSAKCSFRSLNAASKLSSFAFRPLLGGGKDEEIQSFINRMALYGPADSIDKVFSANSTFLISLKGDLVVF